MRLLSNLHVKGKPAVLPDRVISRQPHYFIYRPRNCNVVILAKVALLLSCAATTEFCTLPSPVGFALTVMLASDPKYVLSLSKSILSASSKLSWSRGQIRLLSHLSAMFVHFETNKLKHCYNLRRRLTVALISTSAGPDVSVGRSSCLGRLSGLLLSWVSLFTAPRCSSSLQDVLLLLLYTYIRIYLRNCSCPLQNIRAPKLDSHCTSIPVLALI